MGKHDPRHPSHHWHETVNGRRVVRRGHHRGHHPSQRPATAEAIRAASFPHERPGDRLPDGRLTLAAAAILREHGDLPSVEERSFLLEYDAYLNRVRDHWESDIESMTAAVRASTPLLHLRYGDGEYRSMIDQPGRNSDGCKFFGKTLGTELRQILHDIAALPEAAKQQITVGGCRQERFFRLMREEGLVDSVSWNCLDLLKWNLDNLRTKKFLEAMRDSRQTKILVGNETLAPVVTAFGFTKHVVCPLSDAYLEIDRLERECAEFLDHKYVQFFSSAGMASEPLLWRLYAKQPKHLYFDSGHVFDAIIKRTTRRYLKTNEGGILNVIDKHYRPLLMPGNENG